MTKPEAPPLRRLHPLSWLFITATAIKGLIVPVIIVLFASSTNPMARYELLSVIVIVPALIGALLKQGIYNYRFAGDELVIRDGILIRKERHIPYDRVHNVALVRNPFHRMLGVATARVETAAGGEPEAVMRVLSLEAVDELRRHTLGRARARAPRALHGELADADGTPAGHPEHGAPIDDVADVDRRASALDRRDPDITADDLAHDGAAALLRVPVGELVRLGLISNRGFLVVAAFLGVMSQTNWWERDWEPYIESARASAPAWGARVLQPGSIPALVILVVALALLFVLLLRAFSVVWYVVKYYDFVLQHDDDDLRTEFGLFTRVSSLIPVRRIQLLTVSASLLHRAFDRAGIDVETAGAVEGGGDGDQLGNLGLLGNRQWLAPIISADRAPRLVRAVIAEVDLESVRWRPIAARAAQRILKRSLLALALATAGVMAVLAFTPVPVSGWHALWLPAAVGPLIWLGAARWVRNAGWALTDGAVYFRSGWLARNTSVVRFDKMQTVTVRESPFDRRHRMATVAVDTAGAGRQGHRVAIPYLDVDVANDIFRRLYAETCATEFNW